MNSNETSQTPILPPKITVPDLATIVKGLLANDGEHASTTEKAVSEKIWYYLYSKNKSAIRRDSKRQYMTKELLKVIGRIPDWAVLKRKLPIPQSMTPTPFDASSLNGSTIVMSKPHNYDEAVSRLIASEQQTAKLSLELAQKDNELEAAAAELQGFRDRKEKQSARCSVYGKRGGRGNSL